MAQLNISIRDLHKKADDDIEVMLAVPEADTVNIFYVPQTKQRIAQMTFVNQQLMDQAFRRNGVVLSGREAIFSVGEGNHMITPYIKLSGCPIEATLYQIEDHFCQFCVDPLLAPKVVASTPRRGFAFLYCKSVEEYQAILAENQTELRGRVISITPGWENGRKGQRGNAGGA